MAGTTFRDIGFHAVRDLFKVSDTFRIPREYEFTYTFENFFHPLVDELMEQLNRESVPGLFDPAFHARPEMSQAFFAQSYDVPANPLVKVRSFPKAIDTAEGGPYANYNWELFFHIPLAIAVHLGKNQRFAEAQRWFHYIFDPTALPENYWKFIAFRNRSPGRKIDELLILLSKPATKCTDEEKAEKQRILEGYQAIKDKPFQPHAVARTRPSAYMYNVVMKYLDNLVAWGDHLFRQDTIETINEASQIYVLAANILGPRPQQTPAIGTVKAKSFARLKKQGLDAMGNALVDLEGEFPFNFGLPSGNAGADEAAPLMGIGRTLYFCVPRNDRLLGYWDIVGDRLFKIRHCMNIEGTVRQLALFDPPIDVAMLVKAAAAGIDIGSVVAGLNQPASPIRAPALIAKAIELCAEVRALGNALLSAIEKNDGERLALLRLGHEIKIQQMQQDIRFLQWKQAEEATQALLRTRASALERYRYYLRLLGREPDRNLAPESLDLDRRELTAENFDEAYTILVGNYARDLPPLGYTRLDLAGGGPAGQAGASGRGALSLTAGETDELVHLKTARDVGQLASGVEAVAASFAQIPDAEGHAHYWGLGISMNFKTGTIIQKLIELAGRGLHMWANWEREEAGLAARNAGHQRRVDDWILQANLAGRELQQIGRQVLSSLIAEQIARHEYQTLQKQIEHSGEVDRFLRDKFSNAELYGWMQGELSRLYYEYYRFAFDLGRRAEQAMKRELSRPELDGQNFVKFNYWDAGRKGLLSGEALHLDLKRMEMAYHEHNRREYELTKHVSLMQVDPFALIALRTTGRCTIRLPEALFDMDGAGHYFRRIRSVALSVPCVTGPYVAVNCKLTLLRSSIRTAPGIADRDYPREGAEDDRFQDFFGSIESVVASSGQQDGGLFETRLDDSRPLPFEGAGVISEWRLELPGDPSKKNEPVLWDYGTISDAILHFRFTARDGGATLRKAALKQFEDLFEKDSPATARLFSARHEFSSEWARFSSPPPAPGARPAIAFDLRPEHYPYWSQGRVNEVKQVDLFAERKPGAAAGPVNVFKDDGTPAGQLVAQPAFGDLLVARLDIAADPVGELKLLLDDAEFADLWLVVTWHE